MRKLTHDEAEEVKLMLTTATLQELAQIAFALRNTPERIVQKLSEAERKKGFSHYDSQIRAFDVIAVLNEFLKPLRPMLG